MRKLVLGTAIAATCAVLIGGAVAVGGVLENSRSAPVLELKTYSTEALARSGVALYQPPSQSPFCGMSDAAREHHVPFPAQTCPITKAQAISALSAGAQRKCPPGVMCVMPMMLVMPHTDQVREAQLAVASSSNLVRVGSHHLVWAIAVSRQFGPAPCPPRPAGSSGPACGMALPVQLLELVDARDATVLATVAPV